MQNEILTSMIIPDEKGLLPNPGWARSEVMQYERSHVKAPWFRKKEWDYYLFNTPEAAVAFTISDLGYVGLLSASFLDLKEGTEHTESEIALLPRGRKFGLGLVLSSQRPSELSQTVLSQCNTFLLHRISNDKDQDLVKRLLPDNLHGLMRDLPVLPSRQAILLGWASELPVLVQMRELPKEQRPQSSDPDFWDVWTREKPRDVNWKTIADDWQGVSQEPATEERAEDGEETGNVAEEAH